MKLLREPFVLLLFSAALAGLVFWGQQAPAALPGSVPDNVFSAKRALDQVDTLFEAGMPHPAGSMQNQLLRQRIQAQLEKSGLSTEVQSEFHCRPKTGLCSPVENLLARLKGKNSGSVSGSALLLTAHYDSVEAGPGIGDDGAGVLALLEIADMAARQGNWNHDLIFLFSDAEEQGLLGADAFAENHPWFKEIEVVINLDARGVTGASTMFETGEGNRSYIRMLAQSLERPVANSISREVYRRMPNDTDFSIYRDLGLSGLNFAFTGGAAVYHSAVDDSRLLDADSLQHHGQNSWSLLQVLDQRDLQRVSTSEDAVYIDLLGQKLLHFPASSATGLALVLAVLILVLVRMTFPRQITFRQIAWCVLFISLSLPLMMAMGWILSWPLGHWPDLNRMGHPYPWLGRMALFFAALLSLHWIVSSLGRRASTGSVSLTCWLLFAVLAMLLSVKLPSASILGILPMVGFMLGAVLDGFLWRRYTHLLFARLFGYIAAAYLGFYFFYSLEVVLSFESSHWLIAPLIFPLIAVMPLLAEQQGRASPARWISVLLVLPILAACVGQQFIPGHTIERPRAMNLVYHAAAGKQSAWWQLESGSSQPDKIYTSRQDFQMQSRQMPVWGQQEVWAKAAEDLEFPSVSLLSASNSASGKSGSYEFVLQIPNEMRQLAIFLPEKLALAEVHIDGVLALEAVTTNSKDHKREEVYINRPSAGPMTIKITPAAGYGSGTDKLELDARARFGLDEESLKETGIGWPPDAQPQRLGNRAEVYFKLEPDM